MSWHARAMPKPPISTQAWKPLLRAGTPHISVRQFAYYRVQALQGKTHWDMKRLVRKHGEILRRLEGRSKKSSNKIIAELRNIVLEGMSDPEFDSLEPT
jgi:hypothetical protein